ncbi:MAG: DMT family transporter [Polaribacter sp.]|nr:DMT family transporter [Polaribacter sp.]
MIYLLLSILFSSGLFVIFKFFSIYKIDVLKAIVVNYITAFILGFLFSESNFSILEVSNQPWFLGSIFLGILFVAIFFVMAMTSQKNGVSVASVAGKMSVVIPVFFGIFLYNESFSFLKITGIFIVLIAVYLTSFKEEKSISQKNTLLFPVLLFLGSGTIDTVLKYIEINFVSKEDVSIFSGSLFGIAAIVGCLFLLIQQIKQPTLFGIKNLIAGILLGVPNYFSIIFLIKSLQTRGFESSMLFTINNVGIVVLSTIFGVILFKEHFSLKNKIGIALAIFGIIMVAVS